MTAAPEAPPPDLLVGNGLDVHRFAADGAPLVLAGLRIPDGPGLAGHSDADVVCHAAVDAVLGAAGRGDIGTRFGVDRPETAGASSLGLLAEVVGDLAGDGLTIGNLDVTVVAQRPRLAPHRSAMVDNLRGATGTEAVGLSVTTTDGLGALGRGEGVACWAVCLLRRAG